MVPLVDDELRVFLVVEIEMGSWQAHRRASSCVACYNNCCNSYGVTRERFWFWEKKEEKKEESRVHGMHKLLYCFF